MKKEQAKATECDNCRSKIHFGTDVLLVERCVSGPRDIIRLGEIMIFCSEECVSSYFNHDSLDSLPEVARRIP